MGTGSPFFNYNVLFRDQIVWRLILVYTLSKTGQSEKLLL